MWIPFGVFEKANTKVVANLCLSTKADLNTVACTSRDYQEILNDV